VILFLDIWGKWVCLWGDKDFEIMIKYSLAFCLIILGFYLKAQTVSAGFGRFNTNQEVFRSGNNIQIDAGLRFSKFVSFNISYSNNIIPDVIKFHPKVIRYYYDSQMSGTFYNSDTFYNVTETRKFSFQTYLFKARFYCNPKNKLNLFISPIVGFSKLTETINRSGQDYNNSSQKYPLVGFINSSAGMEIGLEFPLTRRKNIFINVSNTFLYISTDQLLTDVYNPEFNSQNTKYNSFQISFRYEFSKKFTTPKTIK